MLDVTLPPMPVRVVAVEAMSGPGEMTCRPADGKGCGRFLGYVGGVVAVRESDLTTPVAGEERWECWTCWRAVVVQWARPAVAGG